MVVAVLVSLVVPLARGPRGQEHQACSDPRGADGKRPQLHELRNACLVCVLVVAVCYVFMGCIYRVVFAAFVTQVDNDGQRPTGTSYVLYLQWPTGSLNPVKICI